VHIFSTARDGAFVSTRVIANGDNDLRVGNHGTGDARSDLNIESTGKRGGTVRGDIAVFNFGGDVFSAHKFKAAGPGALVDVQEAIVSRRGTIAKREKLVAKGNSQIHWRSQDIAERGGRIEDRKTVKLQSDRFSRGRLIGEMINDSDGRRISNFLGVFVNGENGGTNDHRLFQSNMARGGDIQSVLRAIHKSNGGVNWSDIKQINGK